MSVMGNRDLSFMSTYGKTDAQMYVISSLIYCHNVSLQI